MPTYEARVRLTAYVETSVVADTEEEARGIAFDNAYETAYPEISDSEIDWIEERIDEQP